MRLNLAALVVVFGASRTKRVGAPTRTPDAFSAVTRSSPTSLTTLQSDGSCPDFLAIYWRPRSMDSAY